MEEREPDNYTMYKTNYRMLKNAGISILFILLYGCNSKGDALRQKINAHVPTQASAAVIKICNRYIEDCIVFYNESGSKTAKITSDSDIKKAQEVEILFRKNHPENYMLKSGDAVCKENGITSPQDRKQLEDFTKKMMGEYFDLVNK